MNANQFKKLLKMRVVDSLSEYIDRMEAVFGDDYWGQDFNMAAAVRGFAFDLSESYSPPDEDKPPEDKEEEPTEEELEDGQHKGPLWRISYYTTDASPREYYVDEIRAPTKNHAMILFNRKHTEEACEVSDIIKAGD